MNMTKKWRKVTRVLWSLPTPVGKRTWVRLELTIIYFRKDLNTWTGKLKWMYFSGKIRTNRSENGIISTETVGRQSARTLFSFQLCNYPIIITYPTWKAWKFIYFVKRVFFSNERKTSLPVFSSFSWKEYFF